MKFMEPIIKWAVSMQLDYFVLKFFIITFLFDNIYLFIILKQKKYVRECNVILTRVSYRNKRLEN